MNVRQIIEEYLKANGYDGLYNDVGECGCEIGDLFTCGFTEYTCEPAHKEKPDPDGEFGDAEWVMVPGKRGEQP